MISDMKLRHVELSGDVEGSYVIEAACTDGRLLLAPDAFARATIGRLGHEPVAPDEFEFEPICAAVSSPEGER